MKKNFLQHGLLKGMGHDEVEDEDGPEEEKTEVKTPSPRRFARPGSAETEKRPPLRMGQGFKPKQSLVHMKPC